MQGELFVWDQNIPLVILQCTCPLWNFDLRLYFVMISGKRYFCEIFLSSLVCIGEARKWSLRSKVIKWAPLSESNLTLLRRIFVSNKFATGDPVSYGQVYLSPPSPRHTLHCSDFWVVHDHRQSLRKLLLCLMEIESDGWNS